MPRVWLARRNLLAGRADRKGASRIAAVVSAVNLVVWTISASHAPVLGEFGLFFLAVAWTLFLAGFAWVLYIALEPMLRRRSPASLVSWTRLLDGRTRDPLVGRDLLFGSLIGAAAVSLEALGSFWLWKTGLHPVSEPKHVENLIGVPGLFRAAGTGIVLAFIYAMGFLVLWQLFSLALRSSVRGAVALAALMLFGQSVFHGFGMITLFLLAGVSVTVFAYSRLGLLASVTVLWMVHLTVFFPPWSDPSAWFFGESVVIFVLGALPALWGAWASTRGRSTAAALS